MVAAPLEEEERNSMIVFVTAGEFPLMSGLYWSQVLQTAVQARKKGYPVMLFAAVPLHSYVKSVLRMHHYHLDPVRDYCEREGILFRAVVTPLTISSPVSLFMRKRWLRRAGQLLSAELGTHGITKCVLHCRSYYATELGLMVKRRLGDAAKVCFDMRSQFPEEFPFIYGSLGRYLYGVGKEWEYDLLRGADKSYLPVEGGRAVLGRQTGITPDYLPIAGFNPVGADFDRRWEEKRIVYLGSVLPWHSASLLADIYGRFAAFRCMYVGSQSPPLPGTVERTAFPGSEMQAFLQGCLASIICGREYSDNFFDTVQTRTNFFTTKATEALSLGVPLIVGSQLHELAEFVRTYRCGLVYDTGSQSFENIAAGDLLDKQLWGELTRHAMEVATLFSRDSLLVKLCADWSALLEDQARGAVCGI
jgi:hypothetical protein